MNSYLKELFTFTSGEKKGLLLLAGIIILLLLGILILPLVFRESESSKSAWIEEMSQIKMETDQLDTSVQDSAGEYLHNSSETKLFNFNPNLATEQDLITLGLSQKQVNTLVNYRNKGGKFRNAGDFSKIYGIGARQFEKLKPFIKIIDPKLHTINDSNQHKASHRYAETTEEIRTVEINSCDSFSLIMLPGIGKTLASRIIKYRDRLGGFYDKSQLLEIYGLTTETYAKIAPGIILDSSQIRPIKINTVEFAELRKHPYLNPYQVKCILKFRELKNRISKGDLEKNNILPLETIRKLTAYLSYN